jgi:hypothetical protein
MFWPEQHDLFGLDLTDHPTDLLENRLELLGRLAEHRRVHILWVSVAQHPVDGDAEISAVRAAVDTEDDHEPRGETGRISAPGPYSLK